MTTTHLSNTTRQLEGVCQQTLSTEESSQVVPLIDQ